jgi:dihydrofolate reductase
MTRLKLQMNISLDGKWDDEMTNFSIANLNNVDSIVLGRVTAQDFIPYWQGVARNPKDSLYQLGKPLSDIPKIVFSREMKTSKWDNATLTNGEISEEIKHLKKQKANDLIVYGGDSFASSLIQHGLIDDFYLLVNPVAIGNGQRIFNPLKNDLQLKLEECKPFSCGAVLLHYKQIEMKHNKE